MCIKNFIDVFDPCTQAQFSADSEGKLLYSLNFVKFYFDRSINYCLFKYNV